MFNYFTRVADATGIEFDYQTHLPDFVPDLDQTARPRPDRSVSSDRDRERIRPRDKRLSVAWHSWRTYLLEADGPISRPQRDLLVSVAAEEAADWRGAAAFRGRTFLQASDDRLRVLAEFARKLSREPWRMEEGDVDRLRAAGYSDVGILHTISIVAHQNADSRLSTGLAVVSSSTPR
jgi:hypothetical protein